MAFDESKHPRNKGKFASGSGGGGFNLGQRVTNNQIKRDLRPAHVIARAYGVPKSTVASIKSKRP